MRHVHWLSVILLMTASACGESSVDAPDDVRPEDKISLALAATSISLPRGTEGKLHVSVSTTNPLSVYILEFESSDPSVLEVTREGLLSAKAVGTATLGVTATLLDTGAFDARTVRVNVEADGEAPPPPVNDLMPFVRLDVGGAGFTGSATYIGDDADSPVAFSTSKTTTATRDFARNSADEKVLLRASRWWDIAAGQSAKATVANLKNGTYAVRFLVCEQFWSAVGARAFAFDAEGIRRTSSIDPYQLGGSRKDVGTWVTVTGIEVADGKLDLAWPAIVDNPAIHALEIAGPGYATPADPNAGVIGGTGKRPAGAAPLLGMNIGAKNYDDPVYQERLSRLDIAILGFYPGWRGDKDGSLIRRAVQQIKAFRPAVRIGQYTILNESQDDPAKTTRTDKIAKLDQMNWWLRKAGGGKVQWTPEYNAFETNFAEWAPKDANGDRYSQWLAKADYALQFKPIPEIDIWYHDNVMRNSRAPASNWRYDGVDVSGTDATIAAAFRKGQVAHWAAGTALNPMLMHMGNTDGDMSQPEYRGQLQASFYEGIMGKSYSLINQGWTVMMQRYFANVANLKSPKIFAFNVHGSPTNYQFFRFAFASCRLGDGHFAFTSDAVEYSSVEWFDEYELAFGAPLDAPSYAAWSNGVSRRRFEHAMVLVNPQSDARTVTIEAGWRRFQGRQATSVNNGTRVTTITIPAKDGIVLVRE